MSVRRLPPVLMLHLKRFEHKPDTARWGGSGGGGGSSGGGGLGGLGGDGTTVGRKIEAHVAFPFTLNMRPYCASSMLRSRYGNRVGVIASVAAGDAGAGDVGDASTAAAAAERDSPSSSSSSSLSSGGKHGYDLFAVVVHTGTMESGHYIAYVQWQGAWFRCDDHQVTRVDPTTVAAAQAYLLFYSAKTEST